MYMTGLLLRNNHTYIFRNDDHNYIGFVAWDAYDFGHRVQRQKWKKLPAGVVIVFDIDNPPATVPYLPSLGVLS